MLTDFRQRALEQLLLLHEACHRGRGQQLRTWYATKGRPLIWADANNGSMLLDPLVASRLAASGIRFSIPVINEADVLLFAAAWRAPSWEKGSFEMLAAATPKYLHFHWPAWNQKEICAAFEANASLHVMGTNGQGECVYWEAATPASVAAPARWECLRSQCPRSNAEAPLHAHLLYSTLNACLHLASTSPCPG